MKIPFSGGCSCEAIRYECAAEPIMMFNCHCRECQRASAGAFSAVIYISKRAFKFTRGSPRHYSTPSEAGSYNKRGFCAECGPRISGGETADGIGVTASILDDPGLFCPQMDIFTTDAQPWDWMNPELPKFEKYAG